MGQQITVGPTFFKDWIMIDYKGFKIHYWGYRGWQVESEKKVYNRIFSTDGAALRFVDSILANKNK